MTLRTIIQFQFGNAEAIRETARSSGALWIGAALCLLTSIARNYDQTWILETPFWLIGNLLFSLVSSGLIFLPIHRLFIKRRIPRVRWTPISGHPEAKISYGGGVWEMCISLV